MHAFQHKLNARYYSVLIADPVHMQRLFLANMLLRIFVHC